MIIAYLVFIVHLLTALGHCFVYPIQIIGFVVPACFDCTDVSVVVEHFYLVLVVAANMTSVVANCEGLQLALIQIVL